MAVAKRIIPCLDVNKGRVVKGINFKELKDARNLLLSGADRVSINTAGVVNPELIQELMCIFLENNA